MSPTVEENPNADGTVCNTVNKEEGILRDFPTSSVTPSPMRELCEKHYAQILPFMAEKSHNEKLKDVRSRLTYREDTEQETESAPRHRKRKRRSGKHKEIQKSPSPTRSRSEPRGKTNEGNMRGNSYGAMSLVLTNANEKIKENTEGVSKQTQATNCWKVKTVPEEDTGRDDPEKPEKMKVRPTMVCELPPESIDNFKDLRIKFLAHYLQRKKYTKDPVKLCHVKQKEGESAKAFMKRYTSESLMFKGAPELMRISGFMHGITHSRLIKRLNDNIPKTVNEMMSVTKAFIRREKAVTTQSKRRGQTRKQQDFRKPRQEQGFERKEDFRRRPKDRRGDRFTL
ncbi:hypothetical protein Tco_0683597 [Tanacetum coccineum]